MDVFTFVTKGKMKELLFLRKLCNLENELPVHVNDVFIRIAVALASQAL